MKTLKFQVGQRPTLCFGYRLQTCLCPRSCSLRIHLVRLCIYNIDGHINDLVPNALRTRQSNLAWT